MKIHPTQLCFTAGVKTNLSFPGAETCLELKTAFLTNCQTLTNVLMCDFSKPLKKAQSLRSGSVCEAPYKTFE